MHPAMRFAVALVFGLLSITSATVVDDVVGSTRHVIAEMQSKSKTATERFGEPSKFNAELDKISSQVAAGFDTQLYSSRQQAFSRFAQRASTKAEQSLSETNATIAEERLDEAEEALSSMAKENDELDELEDSLHDQLKDALGAKLNPELVIVNGLEDDAARLQHQAHSMMDPLYSWGDAAEDMADGLNDETNDAQASLDEVVRRFRRSVTDHSRSVQRSTERSLFVGEDREDRVAKSREVRQLVRSASARSYIANLSLLDLPVSIGLTVMFAGATVGLAVAYAAGLVIKFKSQRPRNTLYEPLSA